MGNLIQKILGVRPGSREGPKDVMPLSSQGSSLSYQRHSIIIECFKDQNRGGTVFNLIGGKEAQEVFEAAVSQRVDAETAELRTKLSRWQGYYNTLWKVSREPFVESYTRMIQALAERDRTRAELLWTRRQVGRVQRRLNTLVKKMSDDDLRSIGADLIRDDFRDQVAVWKNRESDLRSALANLINDCIVVRQQSNGEFRRICVVCHHSHWSGQSDIHHSENCRVGRAQRILHGG